MRNFLIVASSLVSIAAFAHAAVARSICDERRDACYSALGRAVDKDAVSKCDAEYARCVHAGLSAGMTPIVPTVTGLGMPMQRPYPTAAAPVNQAVASSNAAKIANTRTAKKLPSPKNKNM